MIAAPSHRVGLAAGSLVFSFIFSACKPTAAEQVPAVQLEARWKICQAASGAKVPERAETRSDNTVLLDSATGQTWLFWPTPDRPARYSWIALTLRTDSPVMSEKEKLGPTASVGP